MHIYREHQFRNWNQCYFIGISVGGGTIVVLLLIVSLVTISGIKLCCCDASSKTVDAGGISAYAHIRACSKSFFLSSFSQIHKQVVILHMYL